MSIKAYSGWEFKRICVDCTECINDLTLKEAKKLLTDLTKAEWAEHRRYDVSRRFRAGKVPLDALIEKLTEKAERKDMCHGI